MRFIRQLERFFRGYFVHTLIVSVVIIWGVSLAIFILGVGASVLSRRVAIWFMGNH
jgi:hypothetical protein